MINEILHSITKKLKDNFDLKVYIDNIEQGFTTPSFYVQCINFDRERLLTNERTNMHFRNNLSFAITYFPNNSLTETNEDINEKLLSILDMLDVLKSENFRLRLISNNPTIVDNRLVLVLKYRINTFIKKSEEESKNSVMKNLDITERNL